MPQADTSPCRDRLPKLEIHAPAIPAARSACPTQTDASLLPPKEFAWAAPNTSVWDARWRFSPSVRLCRCWNNAAPAVLVRPESRASLQSLMKMPTHNRGLLHPGDFSPREIRAAAAYPDCGSSESESRSAAQRGGRSLSQLPSSVGAEA